MPSPHRWELESSHPHTVRYDKRETWVSTWKCSNCGRTCIVRIGKTGNKSDAKRPALHPPTREHVRNSRIFADCDREVIKNIHST